MRNASKSELYDLANKEHEKHYAQIQGQIFATRVEFADLFYWSPQGTWRKRIIANRLWFHHYFVDMERIARKARMFLFLVTHHLVFQIVNFVLRHLGIQNSNYF